MATFQIIFKKKKLHSALDTESNSVEQIVAYIICRKPGERERERERDNDEQVSYGTDINKYK